MLIKHINILSGGALVLTFAILTLILSFFLLLDSRTQSVGWNHLSRFPLLASGIVYSGLQDKLDYIYSSLCSLKNCGVTEAGCEFLSKALSLNPSHLRVLDLSWNDIGDSGVKHLCAALEKVHCAL